MTENPYNNAELREFLLDAAPEERRMAIEERFLADDDFSAELGAAEDELIEAYLLNQLSARDRRRFEAAFLTQPRRRERVLMMKGLLAATAAEAPSKAGQPPSFWANLLAPFRFESSFARYAFAAAVLVVLVLGALLLFNNLRSEPEERFAQQQPTPTPTAAAAVSPQPTPKSSQSGPTPEVTPTPAQRTLPSPSPEAQPAGPTFATIILRPTLVRDPRAANKLAVGSSVKEIRLQLGLEHNDYKSYAVRIVTVEGNQVWQASSIRARTARAGSSVSLSVPARRLPAGDYLVEVSGVSESGASESVSSYFFSVARQ